MKIQITKKAKDLIDAFVAECAYEINGYGYVVQDGETFTITDIYITKQEVGPAHVDVEPKDIAEFNVWCVQNNIDLANIKCQWHSHVDMPTYCSGTDVETAGTHANGWMLSLVVNKKGEYHLRMDVYNPCHLIVDKLTLEVLSDRDQSVIDWVKSEIKDKVTVEKVEASHGIVHGHWENKDGGKVWTPNYHGENSAFDYDICDTCFQDWEKCKCEHWDWNRTTPVDTVKETAKMSKREKKKFDKMNGLLGHLKKK